MTTERFDKVIARADRVMRQLDERDGAVREAARRRELKRLTERLVNTLAKIGIAVGGISLAVVGIGLVTPIGMFGFLAAVGLAIGIATLIAVSAGREIAKPEVRPDLPNGQMVQRFDNYIYRQRAALPAPARAELDSISAILPALKQTLERVEDLNPDAQDARRLMSKHLPGLIDHYVNVPPAYRSQRDGEDVTVDERLVEALSAGRAALTDISDRLARSDVQALETQGRFIKSRYGEERIDG